MYVSDLRSFLFTNDETHHVAKQHDAHNFSNSKNYAAVKYCS